MQKTTPDGSALYELYVLVAEPSGAAVIFELYEPVNQLNALLWRTGLAAAGVPSIILIALGMSAVIIGGLGSANTPVVLSVLP